VLFTSSSVSLFNAEYIESRFPESVAGPDDVVEMSGSKRRRANSRREASHRGVSFAICGLRTSTKYLCSALAICNSAHAEKMAILTITSAFELSPLRSPIDALSESAFESLASSWNQKESTYSRNSLEPRRATSICDPCGQYP
jgi:hypothetical protein